MNANALFYRQLIQQAEEGHHVSLIYDRTRQVLEALRSNQLSHLGAQRFLAELQAYVEGRLECFDECEPLENAEYEEGIRNLMAGLSAWSRQLERLSKTEAYRLKTDLADALERSLAWEDRLHQGTRLLHSCQN